MDITNIETPIRKDVAPFSAEETERIKQDFFRDGFRRIPGLLEPDEIEALKAALDRVFEEPRWVENGNVISPFIALRLFEADPIFEDLMTREPLISLAESILGADCHMLAENAIRNAPGQAIDAFHVDDSVIFPVPEGRERHDPRLQMPFLYFNATYLLTDVPSDEYGPTQYIAGSHYSGRHPNDPRDPQFEGRKPVSLLGKAGDLYLFNGQGWHRGAPNTSDQTRYLVGVAWARRWIAPRLFPFVTYRVPDHVLARADERRRRVLGFHPKGAYG
jgi:hypothetical protein